MCGRPQRLGVLRQSGHEHFSGSLIVPLCNVKGEVIQLYGRKANEHLRAGTPLHLYLPARAAASSMRGASPLPAAS